MELIEKYGGDGPAKGKKKKGDAEGNSEDKMDGKQQPGGPAQGAAAPNRTRMPPPPTANIQRRDGPPAGSPVPAPNPLEPSAEFAPNAEFSGPPPAFSPGTPNPPPSAYSSYPTSETHWYDRIFDVLLGEDETAPKNRIVLICQSCRLVNGQAPPGTKTLAEIGSWRCMSCGALNGEMDEGKRIVNEVLDAARDAAAEAETATYVSDDIVDVTVDDVKKESEDDGPAAAVRKRRGKGKK